MKKMAYVAMAAFVLNLMAFGLARADQILEAKVYSVQEGIGKNGQQFVRVVVVEKRQLNGHSYEAAVPVMAFGSTVQKAKALVPGNTLKAIVSQKTFAGNTSYILHAILDK